jgi:hypothetical protein
LIILTGLEKDWSAIDEQIDRGKGNRKGLGDKEEKRRKQRKEEQEKEGRDRG